MMGTNFNEFGKVCFRCEANIEFLESYTVFESEDGRRVYLHRACVWKIAHDWCMHKLEDKKYVRKK
jgi:hypothetical protein